MSSFAPKRYILTGFLTIIPLLITWLVLEFVFSKLSAIGRPWVKALQHAAEKQFPIFADYQFAYWLESALAFILTIVLLYLVGWIATRVIGKRVISLIDAVVARIPLVTSVYSAVKKMVTAIQQEPAEVKRVVMIPFPTPEMKTVGFVTRILKDSESGESLAAVYVPTTPNPTSGYLEIVPLEHVISTDWTIDEAMSFVISGGAVAPETIKYR